MKSFRAFDSFLYLWQPLIILLTGLNLLFGIAQGIFGDNWYIPWLSSFIPYWIWTSLVVLGLFLPMLAFGLEDADWKAFWLFPSFILFNLTWIPISLKGLLRHKDTNWSHTEHKRSIALTELAGSHGVGE